MVPETDAHVTVVHDPQVHLSGLQVLNARRACEFVVVVHAARCAPAARWDFTNVVQIHALENKRVKKSLGSEVRKKEEKRGCTVFF